MNENELLNLLKRRRKFFEDLLPVLEGTNFRKDGIMLGNTCPSCGFPTLSSRYNWEICSICFWEDDGQDDVDADVVYGGPNGKYSLTNHRIEWLNKLDELKKEKDEIGNKLQVADQIILSGATERKDELLSLIKEMEIWFDNKRGLQNEI